MTQNQRVVQIFEGLIEKTKELLAEQKVTHDEYREFSLWLDRLGRAGEIPLFLDVFFETHVLQGMYKDLPGTEPSLLGPFYIENSPVLQQPYVLPMRDNEPGDVLIFSGTLKGTDGKPIPNAMVELWHCDANGDYSHFVEGVPLYNLRGQFQTDEEGRFEVQTRVPVPYKIPDQGPTGEFLGFIDHHAYRPAHLHFRIEPKGYEKLITQGFFEGDPWIETDVAEGVRESLITKLTKVEEKNGRAVCRGSMHFELRPA